MALGELWTSCETCSCVLSFQATSVRENTCCRKAWLRDWIACCASRKLKLCRNNLKEIETTRKKSKCISWISVSGADATWHGAEQGVEASRARPCIHDETDAIKPSSWWLHSFLSNASFILPWCHGLSPRCYMFLSEVFSRWRSSGRISWCISSTLQAWCHEGRC